MYYTFYTHCNGNNYFMWETTKAQGNWVFKTQKLVSVRARIWVQFFVAPKLDSPSYTKDNHIDLKNKTTQQQKIPTIFSYGNYPISLQILKIILNEIIFSKQIWGTRYKNVLIKIKKGVNFKSFHILPRFAIHISTTRWRCCFYYQSEGASRSQPFPWWSISGSGEKCIYIF